VLSKSARSSTKTSKCKVCRDSFVKRSMTHKLCDKESCAIAWGLKEREKRLANVAKEDRKNASERRQKLKTRSDYIKECQNAFNALVRTRDKDKPCICCGEPLGKDSVGGGFDCGHYRSVGSAPQLRFNLDNAHGQRKKCNRYGAGRAVDYRLGLIERIGLERVERLEADQSSPKWTIPELVEMKKQFMRMRKEIENEQAALG